MVNKSAYAWKFFLGTEKVYIVVATTTTITTQFDILLSFHFHSTFIVAISNISMCATHTHNHRIDRIRVSDPGVSSFLYNNILHITLYIHWQIYTETPTQIFFFLLPPHQINIRRRIVQYILKWFLQLCPPVQFCMGGSTSCRRRVVVAVAAFIPPNLNRYLIYWQIIFKFKKGGFDKYIALRSHV